MADQRTGFERFWQGLAGTPQDQEVYRDLTKQRDAIATGRAGMPAASPLGRAIGFFTDRGEEIDKRAAAVEELNRLNSILGDSKVGLADRYANSSTVPAQAAPAAAQAAPAAAQAAPAAEKPAAMSFQDVLKKLDAELPKAAPNQRTTAKKAPLTLRGYDIKTLGPVLSQLISSGTSTATSRPRITAKEAASEVLLQEILSPPIKDAYGNKLSPEQMQADIEQKIALYKMVSGTDDTALQTAMAVAKAKAPIQ